MNGYRAIEHGLFFAVGFAVSLVMPVSQLIAIALICFGVAGSMLFASLNKESDKE